MVNRLIWMHIKNVCEWLNAYLKDILKQNYKLNYNKIYKNR